jgi:threonine dehydratase
VQPRGRHVVLVVSGGNLDIQWLDRIIQRGALTMGRRMRLRVLIPDLPGALSKITGIIAQCGANILQVYHDRLAPEHPVHVSRVEFDLETQGHDHAANVLQTLRDRGVQVIA